MISTLQAAAATGFIGFGAPSLLPKSASRPDVLQFVLQKSLPLAGPVAGTTRHRPVNQRRRRRANQGAGPAIRRGARPTSSPKAARIGPLPGWTATAMARTTGIEAAWRAPRADRAEGGGLCRSLHRDIPLGGPDRRRAEAARASRRAALEPPADRRASWVSANGAAAGSSACRGRCSNIVRRRRTTWPSSAA